MDIVGIGRAFAYRESTVSAQDISKRCIDLMMAVVLLVVLAPVFMAIAAFIRLDGTGPVFYRSVRVGRHGKLFRMFKFRTMVAGADKAGGLSAADNDPRITPIGGFLRKHKLDELPQLLNVFAGEMSFVGPRPEVLHYVAMFTEEEKEILSVRPGMTDWASLWNADEGAVLAESADPERTYAEKIRPQKLKLQLKYVRERSLSIDLRILLKTAAAMLSKSKPGAMSVIEGKG